MTDWITECCAERPEELQTIANGLLMERRDIEEKEMPEADGAPGYTYFQCRSRRITVSELAMLRSIEEIDTSKALDDYTMQLIEEGVL